jgi:hypothetical protein
MEIETDEELSDLWILEEVIHQKNSIILLIGLAYN